MTKAKKTETIRRLLAEYPNAKCALNYDSNFHLLVAVCLSAQTTDVSVNKVTPALFAAAPLPSDLAAMPQETVESYIKSIGMYHQKAKNLRALSATLCERFGGEVPGDYESLVSLPGVGRKTANVVLSEAFGQQRIAVDTHVFRVSNKCGLVSENDVLATEKALMQIAPEKHWTQLHHALIWHGRLVCNAKKPLCEKCCLADICVSKQK